MLLLMVIMLLLVMLLGRMNRLLGLLALQGAALMATVVREGMMTMLLLLVLRVWDRRGRYWAGSWSSGGSSSGSGRWAGACGK
jgi:hypothetical protein